MSETTINAAIDTAIAQMNSGPAPALPNIDDVQTMSSSQAAAELGKFGADAAAYSKLFSGDGQATKLFHALIERREQLATAESLIEAAADPNVPLPPGGGPNNAAGMSRRDEVQEAQWHLETGASLEEAAEWQVGEAMVSAEDFRTIERTVRARCLEDPNFTKDYLAGAPYAKAIMDRFHRIAVTSRPLPPMPTTGIAR